MKKFYFFDTSVTFAISSLKEQIEGTFFGIFWFLINPIFLFILLFFVFSPKFGFDGYFYYLAIGVLLWSFMQQSLNESVGVNRGNSELIKSLNFPKNVLIFGLVLKNAFLNIGSFFIIALISIFFEDVNFIFMFYPIILFILAFFVYGFGLALSSLSTYNGDFISIWNFFSVIWWFFTPVFYSLQDGSLHYFLNYFNPIFYFLSFFRTFVIASGFDVFTFSMSIFYSLFSLLLGALVYHRLSRRFSEVL